MIKLLLLLLLSFSLYAAENDVTEYYAAIVNEPLVIKVFLIGPHEPEMADTEDYTVLRTCYYLKKLDDDTIIYEYDFKFLPKKAGTFTVPCTVYKENTKPMAPSPPVLKVLKFNVSVTGHTTNAGNEQVDLDK